VSDQRSFFPELKRRNVYKVAIAYAVVGWLVIQITSTMLATILTAVRGRELYGSVGREPTLRLEGDVLGREAGHRIWESREAVSCEWSAWDARHRR
jgi:hypothetical protein